MVGRRGKRKRTQERSLAIPEGVRKGRCTKVEGRGIKDRNEGAREMEKRIGRAEVRKGEVETEKMEKSASKKKALVGARTGSFTGAKGGQRKEGGVGESRGGGLRKLEAWLEVARTGGKTGKVTLERIGQGCQERRERKKEEKVVHKKGEEESEEIEEKVKGGKEEPLKSLRKLKGRKEEGGKKRETEMGCHGGSLWWKRRVRGGRK